ncbi:MAG: hypothetical protein JJ863_08800 [Deltaproteobacteria bacterium]|nr:hypothetical protein [Deltaproteobacteria bacterium]
MRDPNHPAPTQRRIAVLLRYGLASLYAWVVADRLGVLGAADNPAVVWGDFDAFLEYTATLNPWAPRALSDALGYAVTVVEAGLAVQLALGYRQRLAFAASASLSLVFVTSLVLFAGLAQTPGFIAFTVCVGAVSAWLFRNATPMARLRPSGVAQ